MEQGDDMLIEDEVLQTFGALDPSSRTPSGFLQIVRILYPEDVIDLPLKARSWERAKSAVYSLRLLSSTAICGGDIERRTDLSVCLISAIDMILSGRRKQDRTTSTGYSLCRYCWRIGPHFSDRRGYPERSPDVTHAYCGLHKPQAEPVIVGVKGSEARVYRKVWNQKQIQRARKVAKLADRIERWAIQRDHRLSRRYGTVRSWLAGLYIAEKREDLWQKFVSLFFPYIAHSTEWRGACMSPIEAFSVLERDNDYEGREEFHESVRKDVGLLASLVLPMMLRLDVSIEIDLMIANRKRKKKRAGFLRHSWPNALVP